MYLKKRIGSITLIMRKFKWLLRYLNQSFFQRKQFWIQSRELNHSILMLRIRRRALLSKIKIKLLFLVVLVWKLLIQSIRLILETRKLFHLTGLLLDIHGVSRKAGLEVWWAMTIFNHLISVNPLALNHTMNTKWYQRKKNCHRRMSVKIRTKCLGSSSYLNFKGRSINLKNISKEGFSL